MIVFSNNFWGMTIRSTASSAIMVAFLASAFKRASSPNECPEAEQVISKIHSMIHYCNGICISTMGFVIYQFLISMLSMFLLKRDLERIPLESKANLNLRIDKCTEIIHYITHFCFLFTIKIINVVEQ